MNIIDISQELHPGMFVYPGDPHFASLEVRSFHLGHQCEVSELTIGSHCGTHVDAPLHMIQGGDALESIPLEAFYGPCRVITLPAAVISEKMLVELDVQEGERILLRTDPKGELQGPDRFNPAVLSVRAGQYLAEKRISLLGIDSPTVENMELCDGEIHRTLMLADVAILEGLRLDNVEDGEYILCAFPLSMKGENGSPCRAVLIKP